MTDWGWPQGGRCREWCNLVLSRVRCSWALLPPTHSTLHTPTVLFIFVTVSRHWKFHLLNTILPVAMLGWLSFVVFVLPRRELATRLGVIVTLFLALAAVQVRAPHPDCCQTAARLLQAMLLLFAQG